MQMGRVAHHESRVHAFIHLLLLPPPTRHGDVSRVPEEEQQSARLRPLSPSPPFVWRWPSDRFLRDVLLGVNEWVSKEEHGEGGKGAAGKSLGYSIYALPHKGKPLPPPLPLQVPSLSPSPTLSGVFWPYLSIPDPNPALVPCRGSCSEISKSCK